MALDGLLLHQISAELKKELPCRINKIQNVSDVELLFTLNSKRIRCGALIHIAQHTYETFADFSSQYV